jgi:hypothetical protein
VKHRLERQQWGRVVLDPLAAFDDPGGGHQLETRGVPLGIARDGRGQSRPRLGDSALHDDEHAVPARGLLPRERLDEIRVPGIEDVHREVDGVLVGNRDLLEDGRHSRQLGNSRLRT